MIEVKYMSWIPTVLKRESDQIELTQDIKTIKDLIAHLGKKNQNEYQTIFSRDHVIYASKNNIVISKDEILSDGDKISLFSPIAGG